MSPLITPLRPWLEGSLPSTGAEQPTSECAWTPEDPDTLPPPWRELAAVALSVTWAPPSAWRPSPTPVVPTRDFRKGYPWVWDLEVPLRRLSRPLLLRPGLKRIGPPPPGPFMDDLEAAPPSSVTRKAHAQAPARASEPLPPQPVRPPPAPSSAPKGSRMKGWSKRSDWLAEDPWGTS